MVDNIKPLPEDLSPRLEDYLEMVYLLSEKNKVARVKDLADTLSVKKASVVNALKQLENKNYITHEKYSYVELTNHGRETAMQIYQRHVLLTNFFKNILNIDPKIAEENACRIEHYLDYQVLNRLLKFIDFIEECPQGEPYWLSSFFKYIETGKRPEDCGKYHKGE